jgi:hypothetical protein
VKTTPVPIIEPDPLLTVEQVAIHVGNVLGTARAKFERWLDDHTDDRR